jgi:hypothetical protein
VSDDSAAGGGADDNVVMESPLVVVSRVFFSLRLALDLEHGKNFAPPHSSHSVLIEHNFN